MNAIPSPAVKALAALLMIMCAACSNPRGLLESVPSPILFKGNENTAYRDPAVLYHDGRFHLFFTLVEIESDGKVFSYTATSQSRNLIDWTPIR